MAGGVRRGGKVAAEYDGIRCGLGIISTTTPDGLETEALIKTPGRDIRFPHLQKDALCTPLGNLLENVFQQPRASALPANQRQHGQIEQLRFRRRHPEACEARHNAIVLCVILLRYRAGPLL